MPMTPTREVALTAVGADRIVDGNAAAEERGGVLAFESLRDGKRTKRELTTTASAKPPLR